MGSVIEAINRRISTRTYAVRPIGEKEKKRIRDLLCSTGAGPFGNRARFELLDFKKFEEAEIRTLGTYGIIKGADLFIAGATTLSDKSMEDFGYCLEGIILKVTDLGLDTCWLGGTFRRSSFAKRINVTENEIVPAISPIGYGRAKRAASEKLVRLIARSDRRKPWYELFFDGDIDTPLAREKAADYTIPLESVRKAPSASNRQPWRIVKASGRDVYHFYLRRTKGYGHIIREFSIQNIDMGIAMCHFELSAAETGLSGQWVDDRPDLDVGNREYIVSWLG